MACRLCSLDVEQLDRLCVRCEVAARMWNDIFYLVGYISYGFQLKYFFSWLDDARITVKMKKG